MRNVAASLLLAAGLAVSVRGVWAADSGDSIGKAPEWDLWIQAPAAAEITPADVVPSENETPNQRRRRLGITVEASFPAPDFGEAVETPNHRRARLEHPVPEETPNQLRQRLASARTFYF